MAYCKKKRGSVGATVAVSAAGFAFALMAHADTQYTADRAYCMSSEAKEPRALCLKEAAAAQAERQGTSHGMAAHRGAKAASPSTAPAKSGSAP